MSEKPLHVRVAGVLGWPDGKVPEWFRKIPWDDEEHYPRYDIDWSVTGPLIDQRGIELGRFRDGERVAYGGHTDGDPQVDARGETYLIAVCELLLKLPKESHK